MNNTDFLQVAKQAAIEAGEIVKKYSTREHHIHDKGQLNNFATEADLESEKKIIKILKKAFPDHNIIAEEGGGGDQGSEYTWAIDPIDGTLAFTSGFPSYSVSIGLLKNGRPIVGVINQVGTNEIYSAAKGMGAFVNDIQIKVSDRQTLAEAMIGLEFGHNDRKSKIERYFLPIIDKVRQTFVLNAAAVNLAYIARGFLDCTINSANIWDFAAGAIIVEEAGGKVTNHEGGEIDWSQKRILLAASNGLFHDELLKTFNDKI